MQKAATSFNHFSKEIKLKFCDKKCVIMNRVINMCNALFFSHFAIFASTVFT